MADGDITEDDGLLEYMGDYSRNLASLSGDVLAESSNLAGSGDVGFSRPNLRDRSTLLSSLPFHSPATVKPERVLKSIASSSLVKLHLLSLGNGVNAICGGKIGSGQNLQTCVDTVTLDLLTYGVLSHSKKAKGFDENTVYIKTPLIRGKVTVYLTPVLKVSSVSSTILQSLLQLERTVSFWTSLLPHLPSFLSCR